MKLCVFCSANNQLPALFFEKTSELGTWMAQNGHSLVYGGSRLGLMECVAQAVKEAQGTVIGVVPRMLVQKGWQSEILDVEIACEDLNDRKQLMEAQSDAFIALPGGLGTLDEILTIAASGTIGFHHKVVVLYNIGDFWQPFIQLLDHIDHHGMGRAPWQTYIKVANSLEEVSTLINNLNKN